MLLPLKIIAMAGLAAGWFFATATPISTYTNPLSARSFVKTAYIAVTEKINNRAPEPLKGEDRDRVKILFLGMPGAGNDAPYLTDSLIVASVKPSTNQLALISLPRDLLVELPDSKIRTKINALFRMNERNPDLITRKVAEIIGSPIDYYVALDISVTEKITDALGGLNVLVPEDIRDTEFPTPDHGVETFNVQKGWRYFDGATIQKYLRTRHSPDGDFARMRQQQAVLEALRKKIFGLNLLYDLPSILSLYREAENNLQTDLTANDIRRLYDIAKNISYDKVIQKVANGHPRTEKAEQSSYDGDQKKPDSLLESKTISLDGKPAFVLVPKKGMFDYSAIQELAENIFE